MRPGVAALLVLAVIGVLPVAGAAAQQPGALCDPGDTAQFDDVGPNDYGAGYILCARALGLTKGTATGDFDADGKLSREQMAAFLARLWRDNLDKECPSEPAHTFTDVDGSFAEADIACIYALGVTKGTTDTTFGPWQELNTAEVTRFVARLLNKASPGACGIAGDELAQAAACLARLNIAPNTSEATRTDPTPRAQMVVYLIGAWHHASGRGQPPSPLSLAEAHMVALVNELRADLALRALQPVWCITAVARDWSQTMADTVDFEHNPNYSAQYPDGWQMAAENIAFGTGGANVTATVTRLFDALVDSPGHYSNMINPDLTHIGIGVVIDSDDSVWITQNFARYPYDNPCGAT